MHNALGTSQKAITKGSPKCRNCTDIKNSIREGMIDTTSTCDNLLHLQIGHPRISTLPHGQPIQQTGGQSFGQISEWIEYDITCVHRYKLFTDTSYNYNYKLDTMHMQSMCLGTMQVMQYTKQLTCDLRTSSNSPTNYDCARYSSLYNMLWHLQFGIQTDKATK